MASIRADALRCEYLVDPVGVDSKLPRLSWKPVATDTLSKGARQSGYRIQVAERPDQLGSAHVGFWDSGKIASNQTFGVEYSGRSLSPGQTAFWRVQLIDENGKKSRWSRVAQWTASPKWKAKWIQHPDTPNDVPNVNAVNGFHGAEVTREDDIQYVQIDLGQAMPIDEIKLFPARPFDFADTPGFLFPVRFSIEASETADFASPVLLCDKSKADFPNPKTNPVSLHCAGKGRYVRLTVSKLKKRDATVFSYALAEMEVISGGRNVALHRPVAANKSTENGEWLKEHLVDGDTVSHGPKPLEPLPATELRREFELATVPKRVNLFASALGAYEIYINGKRVGDHILAPEWTDYRDRVQFQGFDVTKLLKPGQNVITATLGDGWYAGRVGWYPRAMWGRVPAFLCQLESNGTPIVVSDARWKSSQSGPIRSSDMLDGEIQDARMGEHVWGTHAVAITGKTPPLVSQPNEPIRIHATLRSRSISQPKPGVYVVDLGQNMVGWAKIRMRGKAGQTARMRYAEVLSDDGNVYLENLRSAAQTDSYTFRDSKAVTFQPHFTYHGFRYIEITGVLQEPKLDDVVGEVFNSSSPEVGQFQCSNPMLNRLWENILWTQRGNLMSSPTDCPQRNERLGWMGDIQAFGQTAIYNMDLNGFFAKWAQDQRDSQSTSGLFPEYVPWPDKKNTAIGSPAWSDAGVFVPWLAYQTYGDKRLLANHYLAAKRYVDFLHENNPNGLWHNKRGHDFNDWLNGDTLVQKDWPTHGGAVPPEVLASAFMARSTEIVHRMAAALGKKKDADKYGALATHCRQTFAQTFLSPEGRIKGDTQAGYALALSFDLVPESQRTAVVDQMVEAIAKYGDHVSTGIQTTHRLMDMLSENGHCELAYRLLLNRTFPSWGYSIDNGATTIWERWDGYVKGRGFQSPNMNSFNHWALGAVGEWMMQVIAGIEQGDKPGWEHPRIRPIPGGDLTSAEGSYDSIRGKISVAWATHESEFTLSFVIPANITATVIVPIDGLQDSNAVTILEKSPPAGMKFLSKSQKGLVFEAASGSYTLKLPSTHRL